MKLTKRKLKLLIKEGLTRGLSSLQLEFAANAGDANATGGIDGTGGGQKISGNEVLEGLKKILEDWENPENKGVVEALVTKLEQGITAG
jgi:hypothetical protein